MAANDDTGVNEPTMGDDVVPNAGPGDVIGETFFVRFTELLRAREHQGQHVTNTELAQWMTSHGYPVSPTYISSMRNGHSRSPSLRVIEGLAKYFDVDSSYLVSATEDPTATARVALGDATVTDVAMRASALSAENLIALRRVMDGLRAAEGLPPLGDDDERDATSAP